MVSLPLNSWKIQLVVHIKLGKYQKILASPSVPRFFRPSATHFEHWGLCCCHGVFALPNTHTDTETVRKWVTMNSVELFALHRNRILIQIPIGVLCQVNRKRSFIRTVNVTVFVPFKNGLNAVQWCCLHVPLTKTVTLTVSINKP